MPERCKHGMDPRFCALCNAPPPPKKSGGTKRANAHAAASTINYLDWRFENDGRTLVFTGDLSKGWRDQRRSEGDARKTFCFSETINAEWHGGTIHVQLCLSFPAPAG